MTKHVHHDLIQEWIKDTSRVVESQNSYGHWSVVGAPNWNPNCQYRFKPAEPKYIVVNGVNVPEPVRERLRDQQEFWLADAPYSVADKRAWEDGYVYDRWLSLGLIHLTREAAQAHIDAMLLPSRSDK